jgi:hypothetical protein
MPGDVACDVTGCVYGCAGVPGTAFPARFFTLRLAMVLVSCAVLLSLAALRANSQDLPPDRAPVVPMLVAPTLSESTATAPTPAKLAPVELAPAELIPAATPVELTREPMPAAPTPVAQNSAEPVAFKFSFEHSALPANLLDRSANAIHIEPPPLDNRRGERIQRPLETSSTRRFLLLSAGVYAFALLDIHETASMPHAIELDPLARPFTDLPKPAYYASGVALATTVNVSAWMMARSPRWHRVWWVPQLCSMAGNLWGFASTKARE